jgi:hypothetical protein
VQQEAVARGVGLNGPPGAGPEVFEPGQAPVDAGRYVSIQLGRQVGGVQVEPVPAQQVGPAERGQAPAQLNYLLRKGCHVVVW